ncbi:Zn-dependent hydrolase [Paradesulfitobacterium ferrireducens]|uniref:Zn-dependent hydrolase n=1 Tax=Paradesulfitobacterium ferrireducens TaxID=2816476 RepID=UPI001A8C7472|nr:Zn-dependent hydrolase [Paradesulfitobacterium ferrireducens]
MEQALMKVNRNRLQETIETSAQIGAIPGNGLCRLALSDEDKEIRDLFRSWLKDSGLQVRVDDFGNIYGRREGKKKDAPPILVGSHLDTQPMGGRFDGILGVLGALEVVRTLNDLEIETELPIEIVSFTNEEGARFEPPMLGSGGITGIFDKEFIYSQKDKSGKSFVDELKRIGYLGDESNRIRKVHSYLEFHVEQGPVLEQANSAIGVVEAIQGMTWLEVKLTGEGDHAGPTPMNMRKDALVAAAKMIVAIQHAAREIDEMTTTTVGRMALAPNVVNCIPGEVSFSVDVRHPEDIKRRLAVELVREKISTIAAAEGVEIEIRDLWEIETTPFAPQILKHITEGAKAYGYSSRRIVSGAGHDAKYLSDIAPTAMIFVPSVNGKSHSPEELTSWEDIEQGANVLLYVVEALANER